MIDFLIQAEKKKSVEGESTSEKLGETDKDDINIMETKDANNDSEDNAGKNISTTKKRGGGGVSLLHPFS